MKFNGSFGNWLKQHRKALDLTQQDVADQVGCAVVTVRKIEGDTSRPSKQIAERLADVLAVAPDDRAAFMSFARRVTDQPLALPLDLPSLTDTFDLPQQMTPFIGRSSELADLTARLSDSDCRLLTLVGPGGIGKTRLALEAARQNSTTFAHGAHFVSLAPVNSADLLVSAVGSALKFSFYGQEPPAVQLLNYLRQKRLLLVLDNFEHLLDGTLLLVNLLAGAPHLKLLITSRERLNVQGEWVFQVKGMDYPQSQTPDQLEHYGAVQLFMQSAQHVQANFSLAADKPGVLRICQLVEGMPLGILLAAAWVNVLSVQEIAQEIQQSLNILETDQRDMPPRQRSLRAAFDHSWKLLTDEEREVFKKLSVFRGGFTREAAHQVAETSLKTLLSLVNKSFLRRDATTGRYEIHELLRQYGEEQLINDLRVREHMRDLHSAYYAAYMWQQRRPILGQRQSLILNEIGIEFNNVLEAWNYAIEMHRADLLGSMAFSFWYYCDTRIPHREAASLFVQAVESLTVLPPEREIEIVLGLALVFEGYFIASERKSALQGKAISEKGLIIFRKYGCVEEMLIALMSLSRVNIGILGQLAEGKQTAQEGLDIARTNDFQVMIGVNLSWLATIAQSEGDFVRARQIAEEGLKVTEAIGDWRVMAAAIGVLGGIARELGDYREAQRQFERALRVNLEQGVAWSIGVTYSELGRVALLTSNHDNAKSWLQQSLVFFMKDGRREREYYVAFYDVGRLFIGWGRKEEAVEILSLLQSQTHDQTIRDLATASLSQLHSVLPDDVYAAAVERGKALDLDTVVAEFLAS